MKGSQSAVEAFHAKYDFPVGRRLTGDKSLNNSAVLEVLGRKFQESAAELLPIAINASELDSDHRLYRAHLMIEELGEAMQAMSEREELSLADALGDLVYVVLGTAVTYGIPLEEVFDEIHASNMTKTRAGDDPRMKRGKSAQGYHRPNIHQAIKRGRERMTKE